MMKKIACTVGLFCLILGVGYARMAVDIAISSQANWWSQAAADREMQEIVDNVKDEVNSIEIFDTGSQDELANWAKAHTDNRQIDIIILCGQYPATLYPAGNAKADGSIGELFLEGGNMFINTGDYMFYVVNSAGSNGEGGLQNMMDIPGTTMWDDNTSVKVTAEGKKYLPSLKDFQTDRPFHLNELVDPWEAEVVFASNTGDADATRADPVVVHNTEDDGRLAIFYQTASQDNDPRGEVISEFILNWLPEIISNIAVSPKDNLPTTWAQMKK